MKIIADTKNELLVWCKQIYRSENKAEYLKQTQDKHKLNWGHTFAWYLTEQITDITFSSVDPQFICEALKWSTNIEIHFSGLNIFQMLITFSL